MDLLTAFGLFAVTAMLVCYAFEHVNPAFILGFAVSCALGSIYGFLQGARPFGLVEAIWSLVALQRWRRIRKKNHRNGGQAMSRKRHRGGTPARTEMPPRRSSYAAPFVWP